MGLDFTIRIAQPTATFGGSSYFFRSTFVISVWTTIRVSGSFLTKCFLICTPGKFDEGPSQHIPAHEGCPHPIECITTLFQARIPSTLCLPLALTIQTFRWVEHEVRDSSYVIRNVESRTGHGSWGSGQFQETRDSIPSLTSRLGRTLNIIGSAFKHLAIVESALESLEGLHKEMEGAHLDRSDEGRASVDSILSAIQVQRRQATAARTHCESLERRIRNQSSVVSTITDKNTQVLCGN